MGLGPYSFFFRFPLRPSPLPRPIFLAKSLRRCIAAIEAAEPGCIAVLLQGTLDGNTIQEAGIVAQPKTPKIPKPADPAEATA